MSFVRVRIVAFIVILIAGGIGGLIFQSIANKSGGLVDVYVATKDVAKNVILTEDSIKTIPYPSNFLPKDAIFDKSKIVGRYTNYTIEEGQLLQERLMSQDKTIRERLLTYGEEYTALPIVLTANDFPINMIQPSDSISVVNPLIQNGDVYVAKHLLVMEVKQETSTLLILLKKQDIPNLIRVMSADHRVVLDATPFDIKNMYISTETPNEKEIVSETKEPDSTKQEVESVPPVTAGERR